MELCHESLIESWDKRTQWLAESEHNAQFVARLHAAAQQWEASKEAEGLLWRDRAAREAADWLTQRRAEQGAGESLGLGKREERFLVAVVALSERGRRRRQRIMAGVLATVSAIAVVVFILSFGMRRQAARADRAAVQADQAAAQAELPGRDSAGMECGWLRGALRDERSRGPGPFSGVESGRYPHCYHDGELGCVGVARARAAARHR